MQRRMGPIKGRGVLPGLLPANAGLGELSGLEDVSWPIIEDRKGGSIWGESKDSHEHEDQEAKAGQG